MKITSDTTLTKSSRRITIEGASKMPVTGHSFKGKDYLPESIRLHWVNDAEPDRATVSGPVFKKDGTLGQQYAECDYALTGHAWDHRPDAPDWLREAIA